MRQSEIFNINGKEIIVYKVNNCVNGNPRYVIHFLDINSDYNRALEISRRIGGKKYRAKWFGGGIVISSYNIVEDLKQIIKGA